MPKRRRYYVEDGYYDPQDYIRPTIGIAKRGYRIVETQFGEAFGLDLTKILQRIVFIEIGYIALSGVWRLIRFGQNLMNWGATTGGLYCQYKTPIGVQTLLCVVGDALGLERVGEPTANPPLSPEIILDRIFIDYFYYVIILIPIIIVLFEWWSSHQKKKRGVMLVE
jgi:hypothetical protein